MTRATIEELFDDPEEEEETAVIRRCRICGCTAARGCFGGCVWVGADLCSKCVAKA